jgi:hypothetical protein
VVDWKIGNTRGSPTFGFQPACRHLVPKFQFAGFVTSVEILLDFFDALIDM